MGRLLWMTWLALDTPLGTWRHTYTTLICLRMDVLRGWGIVLISLSTATASQQLQASFDVGIGGIQFCCSGVRI